MPVPLHGIYVVALPTTFHFFVLLVLLFRLKMMRMWTEYDKAGCKTNDIVLLFVGTYNM